MAKYNGKVKMLKHCFRDVILISSNYFRCATGMEAISKTANPAYFVGLVKVQIST